MAGMSFLRDRSPPMPKITRTHGSGTRGRRRSDGSRSGLTPPAPYSSMREATAAGVADDAWSSSLVFGPPEFAVSPFAGEVGAASVPASSTSASAWSCCASACVSLIRLPVSARYLAADSS